MLAALRSFVVVGILLIFRTFVIIVGFANSILELGVVVVWDDEF